MCFCWCKRYLWWCGYKKRGEQVSYLYFYGQNVNTNGCACLRPESYTKYGLQVFHGEGVQSCLLLTTLDRKQRQHQY